MANGIWRGLAENLKSGLPIEYFVQRNIRLDCRGEVRISPDAHLSFDVHIYTASHRVGPNGYTEDVVFRKVWIHRHAWICSNAILYNCIVGEGAVVSVGAVVSSRIVPPWTLVEGNPARIVKQKAEDGLWITLPEPKELERCFAKSFAISDWETQERA